MTQGRNLNESSKKARPYYIAGAVKEIEGIKEIDFFESGRREPVRVLAMIIKSLACNKIRFDQCHGVAVRGSEH